MEGVLFVEVTVPPFVSFTLRQRESSGHGVKASSFAHFISMCSELAWSLLTFYCVSFPVKYNKSENLFGCGTLLSDCMARHGV